MPTGVYPKSEEQRKKISLSLTGKKQTKQTIEKRVSQFRNTKHWNWKGIKAGYRAIHMWVVGHYGNPTTCEHCQTTNLIGHQIHWANKSHKYLRDRTDWLRLCSKCHGLYDKSQKLRQRNND